VCSPAVGFPAGGIGVEGVEGLPVNRSRRRACGGNTADYPPPSTLLGFSQVRAFSPVGRVEGQGAKRDPRGVSPGGPG
jgi:hypothetical protein